jgi:SAM-dependent methyltransferase
VSWLRKHCVQLLHPSVRRMVRRIRHVLGILGRDRFCPVCDRHSTRFEPGGMDHRLNARCFWCGSLERHRLLSIYLERKTNIFSNGKGLSVLHIAPESCLEGQFRRIIGRRYLTADIEPGRADVTMDLTNIDYADEAFDVIICSHVLEHVENDRRAMAELCRILRSAGWAILLVPIQGESTYEDPNIKSPAERLRHFGQMDHVRIYGLDYMKRLEVAGFNVARVRAVDFLRPSEIELMGITEAAGDIFLCRKAKREDERAGPSVLGAPY